MGDFYRAPVDEQTSRLRLLANEALKYWGVEGCEPELLKYRENAVFRVVAPDGSLAALRIHRHGYHSDDALRSELSWMQALRAAGIEVPGVVLTREGALFTSVSINEVPEPRQVDMMGWLTGQPLGTLENGLGGAVTDVRSTFKRVGSLVARLHTHAATWSPPEGFVRHAWDMEGLLGEQPLWGRFWELGRLSRSQRELVDRARTRARNDLLVFGQSSQTYGLIHADFLTDNLILEDDRVKLLDFDDCGFGWHLFDLATISLFFRGQDIHDTVTEAVVEGYRAIRPLTDEQLSLMPLFYLLRSFTYLGWVHTRFETSAARDLAPMFADVACRVAEEYLAR